VILARFLASLLVLVPRLSASLLRDELASVRARLRVGECPRPLEKALRVQSCLTLSGELVEKRMAALAERMEIIQLFSAETFVRDVVELEELLFAADALPRAASLVASLQ
jgi:hypothetical protein